MLAKPRPSVGDVSRLALPIPLSHDPPLPRRHGVRISPQPALGSPGFLLKLL